MAGGRGAVAALREAAGFGGRRRRQHRNQSGPADEPRINAAVPDNTSILSVTPRGWLERG